MATARSRRGADVDDPSSGTDEPLHFIAYVTERDRERAPSLRPAPRARRWIAEETRGWVNRCLPLVVANEAGWELLNPATFTATWDGSNSTAAVTIEYEEEPPRRLADSQFGYGIVTFAVPYLFRTPPGWNLLARGPANSPRDGVAPLEGLVETDWSVATFTMNWKLTRPHTPVTFEAGAPYCFLVPQRRGDLQRLHPEVHVLDEDRDLYEQVRTWATARARAQAERQLDRVVGDRGVPTPAWEKHYFHGTSPGGVAASVHERRLDLRPFADRTSQLPADDGGA